MGIGDTRLPLGECEQKAGMHFSGRGVVHFELIEPETGATFRLPTAPRASWCSPISQSLGAAPALSHPRPCAPEHGQMRLRAHEPRVRCIGRTDDMLIVRGVNVFPSALREVVNEFRPAVAGVIVIRPHLAGVRQSRRCRSASSSRRGERPGPRGPHPRSFT